MSAHVSKVVRTLGGHLIFVEIFVPIAYTTQEPMLASRSDSRLGKYVLDKFCEAIINWNRSRASRESADPGDDPRSG